jgi:general secretion pathway protein E
VRDMETAEMAIQASLTGHLVLSSLHTNDAPAAVSRLLDLGVAPYLLNSSLLGVMAQRLVRTLCPFCKREGEVDDALWEELTHPWKLPKPESVGAAVGCLECRMTGYKGRTGLYEMLSMNASIKQLVTREADLGRLKAHAYKGGMRPLRLDGAEKIMAGVTTIEEVLQVAPPALS